MPSLEVYRRLAGSWMLQHPFIAAFRERHKALLYSRYTPVKTRDVIGAMSDFFQCYKEAMAEKGPDADVGHVHPIWFWLMCAHFAAACFLPMGRRPFAGPPDAISLADFNIF